MPRCKAMVSRSGKQERCKAAAMKGKPFCLFHGKLPSRGSRQMERIRKQMADKRKRR